MISLRGRRLVQVMRLHRAALALALGMSGLTVGIAALAADVTWLGLVAGVMALVAGALAYRIATDLHRTQTELTALQRQVDDLESATADQIQARMSAETDARVAEQRAKKAEIGGNMLSERLKTAKVPEPDEDLTDAMTGLYGEDFFMATVSTRVHSARRHLRPVSVVLLAPTMGVSEGRLRPAEPAAVTKCLLETVREADTACRLVDGRFALILEDTPENGAIWTVERFRRRVAAEVDGITIWAGVACYPAHAFDAGGVVSLAEAALESAQEWSQDRIEVAEIP